MVYVHFADGFEEIEALSAVDILRRADIETRTVCTMPGEADRLSVTGAHGVKVCCDITFGEADFEAAEMLVLPGGGQGADNLLAHEGLKAQLEIFAKSRKWLAAICASPKVFARHGLLQGAEATIYPGMEDELTAAGATPVKKHAVKSGKIITGQGPGAAFEFALALVETLKGQDAAAKIRQDMVIA